MPLQVEDIKKTVGTTKSLIMSPAAKRRKLKDYMISNGMLFEELIPRDKAYEEERIQLTTRQNLSLRLKNRRNAL